MPDITMCHDQLCPMRDNCYRFSAKPNPHVQSYFMDTPRVGDECEFQMFLVIPILSKENNDT